jgi:hypothetical protein
MEREWNSLDPESESTWTWWRSNFPLSSRIYGDPIVFGEPNLDFLSATLNESPIGLIYYPPEGRFYFRDYLFGGAYRPTSEGKVEALARKLLRESAEDSPRTSKDASKPLFLCSRGWIQQAKVIIAVEGHYFTGEEGARRWENGRFIEPVEKPSVAMFTETKVARRKGKILTTPEAYSGYWDFCLENKLSPVKKTVFKETFAYEVKRRWQLGIRNDLKVDGYTHQGWGELAIL